MRRRASTEPLHTAPHVLHDSGCPHPSVSSAAVSSAILPRCSKPTLRLTMRTTNRMRSPPSSPTQSQSPPSTPRGFSPQQDTYLLPPLVSTAPAAGVPHRPRRPWPVATHRDRLQFNNAQEEDKVHHHDAQTTTPLSIDGRHSPFHRNRTHRHPTQPLDARAAHTRGLQTSMRTTARIWGPFIITGAALFC
ncbi:hypothetical protein B0H13DRAFT_2349397 [Mycena leptocephala]|nr:hypothetical protein B0H13DRAFT_2349397 [Mycena leptocephala]